MIEKKGNGFCVNRLTREKVRGVLLLLAKAVGVAACSRLFAAHVAVGVLFCCCLTRTTAKKKKKKKKKKKPKFKI